MDLGIGLLNQRDPELVLGAAPAEDEVLLTIGLLVAGQPVVDDDVAPALVLVEPEDIHAVLSQVVEHGRVDS